MKVVAKEWADGNAEGSALCDKQLGELCYTADAPRAVKLIREMAVRMDTAMKTGEGDAAAVGWMYRLAQRAI